MSNEEQDSRNVERSAEPDLVDPDSVVLDEGTISAEALEPELTVSPETLDLQEPTLGAVEISREIADAASLEDAAAEARAVAEEAEKAGTLVGGPMPTDTPTAKAAPAGTAPAGGTAGDMHRGAPGVGPGGSTARPDTGSGDLPGGPGDVLSPEEVLADATTGTTEDATPHPEPEEVLTESRERASGGPRAEAPLENDAATAVAPGSAAADSTSSSITSAEARSGASSDAGVPTDTPHTRSPDDVRAEPDSSPVSDAGADVDTTRGAGVGPLAADGGGIAAPGTPVAAPGDTTPAAPSSPADTNEDPGMRSRSSATAAGNSGRNGNVPLLLIVAGGVVALGLVIWLAVSLLGGGGGEGSAEQTSRAELSYPTGVQAQADQQMGGAAGPSVRR